METSSDDESDGDYNEFKQGFSEEQIRNWILTQYLICGAPDSDEWDDYLEEKGTISLIEDASEGKFKSSYLFRRQIRRILSKIRECWDNGVEYCPKIDSSTNGRPSMIDVNSAVANVIADLHEKNHLSVAKITLLLNENREVNPNRIVFRE